MTIKTHTTICILLFFASALQGCSLSKWFEEESEQQSAEKIYRVAKSSLLNKRYGAAIEKYQELEQKYPFSIYIQQATLESAYTYYKNNEVEESIALCNRYIDNYPNDSYLDYIYYLKGLSHFNTGKSIAHYILPRDMTTKNTEPLINAFDSFSQLYNRFPNSIYRSDAKQRLIALRNMLAIHELRVAAFYLRHGSYIASINRIKYMLEKYEGAQHIPDGLYLLSVAYKKIGEHDLSRDTLRILRLNYPDRIDKDLNKIGTVSEKEQAGWFDNLKNLADLILEKLRIKPRY